MNSPLSRQDLLCPVAGVLLTLAFAPFNLPLLAVLSLSIIFGTLVDCSPLIAAKRGFLFGLGMFASGIYWVYISVHDYGGASVLGAGVLTVLVVVFWALFPAVTAYIACKLASKPSHRVCLLPFVWIFVEYFRGYWFLNGFPWLQIGYSILHTPLQGYVPIIGVYGVGFLLGGTASILVATYRKQMRYPLACVAVAAIWGTGQGLQYIHWTKAIGAPIKVALIQANIPQEQKWQPQNKRKILATYRRLTRQNWDADIIVWPESALPSYLHRSWDYLAPLWVEARRNKTDLLLGTVSLGKGNSHFNSIAALGAKDQYYHKNHLLPFGEYLPLQPLSGWVLDVLGLQLGDYNSGGAGQPLLRAGGWQFASSICYEDAFASEVLRTLPDAAFLLNVTNDAWFGNSTEPAQHLQIAQMRALESGRYLLRATNTGNTAIIAPNGTLDRTIPPFTQLALTGSITPMGGMTPYARLGDVPIMLLLTFIFAVLQVLQRQTSQKS